MVYAREGGERRKGGERGVEDRVWGMAYSWAYREGGYSHLDEVVFHVCDSHISTVNVIKSRITALLVGLCARVWVISLLC